MSDPTRSDVQQRLGATDLFERPWSLDSMPTEWHAALSEVLTDFVSDYNANFVVKEGWLIPMCWPAHPGLAREIAAMYAHWMHVFHSADAGPTDATYFFDRVLPPFQDRVGRWLGPHAEACRAGEHPPGWNPAAQKIAIVDAASDSTRTRLNERWMALLATTRSAPEAQPEPAEDSLALEGFDT